MRPCLLSFLPFAGILCAQVEPASAEVRFHDPAGRALIAADQKFERLGTGMQFVEGPTWMASTQTLVFSDIPAGRLMQWSAGHGVREFAASEQSNGTTLDLGGDLLVCQHGARNVVRRAADGKTTVLVDAHDGRPLNSPNDVVVRNDGTVWFTDPTYGLAGRKQEQPGNHVYRLDPATGAVKVVQTDFEQPNGLCFAPDHQRLYIADSGKPQRVGAFPVLGDGTLGKAAFWLVGGADGMRCDAEGNLFTTARDGVRIYDPKGRHLVTIACPEQPANCTFGGADGKTLFVTARTSLYRVQVRVAGAPLPPLSPAATAGRAK